MYAIVLMDSGKSSNIKFFKSPHLTFILRERQSLCITFPIMHLNSWLLFKLHDA